MILYHGSNIEIEKIDLTQCRPFKDFATVECNTDNKYDIVTGPVANDDITALINVYLAGILSDEAFTKELTFRELSDQVSFHTERAAACLRKAGAHHG
ncbi:MAG: DUF3990 domain-containing protein [Treponema sp.]|jgi:hypothetical protein|nr:DUF3990 domain-containing protein [Treponema sp.]